MTADVEEVVRRADTLDSENLAPDAGESLFDGGAERRCPLPFPPGRGRALRSILPFGVSGSESSRHEGRGHHVLGEPLAQEAAQIARRDGAATAARSTRPGGSSPLLARRTTTACADRRVLASAASMSPSSMRWPPHLDLVVIRAEELDLAVAAGSARGRRCGTGARRTHPRRRIRHEGSAVLPGSREVARPRAPTPPTHISPGTPRGGAEPVVEHVQPLVGDRPPPARGWRQPAATGADVVGRIVQHSDARWRSPSPRRARRAPARGSGPATARPGWGSPRSPARRRLPPRPSMGSAAYSTSIRARRRHRVPLALAASGTSLRPVARVARGGEAPCSTTAAPAWSAPRSAEDRDVEAQRRDSEDAVRRRRSEVGSTLAVDGWHAPRCSITARPSARRSSRR